MELGAGHHTVHGVLHFQEHALLLPLRDAPKPHGCQRELGIVKLTSMTETRVYRCGRKFWFQLVSGFMIVM